MKKILFLLFLYAAVAPASAQLQLNKYNPPNTVNYTTCYLTNGAAKSYCPIGTYCTQPQLPNGIFMGASSGLQTLVAQLSAPGCCPANTTPCQSHKYPFTVPACCPSGKACCFDTFRPNLFVGCVDDVRQCCGNTICPSGYSCCRRNEVSEFYCCPGLTACSIISNSSNITFWPNQYPPGSNGVLDIQISSTCQQVINATYVQPWSPSLTIPCGTSGSLCLNATEDCYSGNGTNLSLLTGNNVTITQSVGLQCCTKNTSPCLNYLARGQNTLIGCANPALNETCCGHSICPSGSRCCHVAPPQDGTYAPNSLIPTGFFNYTTYNGPLPIGNTTLTPGYMYSTDKCCPIGTFCCARRINLDSTNNPATRVIHVYCGRNEMCTSDALVTESLQPKPSLTGFLPEYIESMGWITPTVTFATTTQNYNCNTCNVPSTAPTACKDPCHLDITAASTCS